MVLVHLYFFFFFKQKTAYEMRISDWSSDVCSSDLFILTVSMNLRGWRQRQASSRRRGTAMRAAAHHGHGHHHQAENTGTRHSHSPEIPISTAYWSPERKSVG